MSETRKLYYEDVYTKEFTANVLECREGKKGYEIILDQTAFHPELQPYPVFPDHTAVHLLPDKKLSGPK